MKRSPFKLRLQSWHDGSLTQLHLSGSVITAPPAVELHPWIGQLSNWSNAPVELVLPADAGTVAWFELWGDAVSNIPVRHLQVRFISFQRHHRAQRGRNVV